MKPRAPVVHPFVGRSTMDALLREIDWAHTSIGSPDTWPGTWRAAVRMVLDSFAPMVLLLGEEMLMAYNDACIPVIGGKHPRCLGKYAPGEWPEIWASIVEPMVKHVRATNEPAQYEDLYMPLERNGYPEETHMVFGVSAVRDDDGVATALLVTVRETTERVLIARLVECLDALSTRCFPAETPEQACTIAAAVMDRYLRDLPFTLMYLVDADGRNARLAAHSGLTRLAPEIAPSLVSLIDIGDPGTWDIARVVRSEVSAESPGVRDRLLSHLRDPSFAAHLVVSMPLADPGGGMLTTR